MVIVWICNILPGIIAERIGLSSVFGGWLDGFIKMLAEDNNRLYVFYPGSLEYHSEDGNLNAYAFSKKSNDLREYFNHQFNMINPDIIHIHGTEFEHSYNAIKGASDARYLNRVIVSIQGLVSLCANHFFDGIPSVLMHKKTLKEMLRNSSLRDTYKTFKKRGEFEEQTIKLAPYIIGRTDWDRACIERINPQVKYFHVNETLRDVFYSGRWDSQGFERYSIYASSGDTPIKGLHYLIDALSIVKKNYPNFKLYLTMDNPYSKNRLLLSSYMRFIVKKINKYGLKDSIVFMGVIDKGRMVDLLSHVNLFVLPSTIENSPNSLSEAMLCGTPCVAADVGGVKSLINHCSEGFIYQGNAPYMLSYYIQKVFGDTSLAKTIGTAASNHAIKTHDYVKNYNDLLHVYNSVIER